MQLPVEYLQTMSYLMKEYNLIIGSESFEDYKSKKFNKPEAKREADDNKMKKVFKRVRGLF